MASVAYFRSISSLRQWKVFYWRQDSSLHTSSLRFAVQLKMPSLSPTMAEGTIVAWHKKEGEQVVPGDVLCDIQTDKAVMAFETEEEGILAKIVKGDDSKDVKVGDLIGVLAEPGEDWKNVQSSAVPSAPSKDLPPAPAVEAAVDRPSRETVTEYQRSSVGPAVRGWLEKYGLSPGNITATGPHGRLLKGDVLSYISQKKLVPVAVPPPSKPTVASQQPIVPVASSGPSAADASKNLKKTVTNLLNEQEYQDIELSNMRRVIAKRLTQSKTGIAHAYSAITCKVDELLAFRKKCKSEGIVFSVNDVIVKAVATALDICPDMNVVWNGDQLVRPSTVDVSVAVATSTGLITPIVTDVASRSIPEIGNVVRDLADRARKGKLQLHEFQGGSFTISNLGMYGVGDFSAIINPPQCGILAVGAGRLVLGEDGKPYTAMTATLSYDGEAVSPATAADFMSVLQSLLESPKTILLGRNVNVANQMEETQ